jgi:hypothetical protein
MRREQKDREIPTTRLGYCNEQKGDAVVESLMTNDDQG